MVAIFFVISGYVLTHRFSTLVYQGKVESALMSMSSATFRRFMRLYVPVLVFTAMQQVLLQLADEDQVRTVFVHTHGSGVKVCGENLMVEVSTIHSAVETAGRA